MPFSLFNCPFMRMKKCRGTQKKSEVGDSTRDSIFFGFFWFFLVCPSISVLKDTMRDVSLLTDNSSTLFIQYYLFRDRECIVYVGMRKPSPLAGTTRKFSLRVFCFNSLSLSLVLFEKAERVEGKKHHHHQELQWSV